jgi:hypothetical protein
MRVNYEARFAAALREIARYMTPEQHQRQAEKRYGLSAEESMGMAIDNMIATAKDALRGYRAPKPSAPVQMEPPLGVFRRPGS